MGLVEELGVRPGITAIIGSGGKTTLMERLARELAAGAPGGGEQVPSSSDIADAMETASEFPQTAVPSYDFAARGLPQAATPSRTVVLDAMRCTPSQTAASSRTVTQDSTHSLLQASASLCTIALATTTRVLPPLDFPLLANLSAAEVAACLPTVGVAYVGSVREAKGVRKLGAPLWNGAPGTEEKRNPASQTYAFTSAHAPNSTVYLTGLSAGTSMNVPAGANASADLSATADTDVSSSANASDDTGPSIGRGLSTYNNASATTNVLASESREDVEASIGELARLATYTLVEADGSHHLPLKAHASWEPVVPAGARAILVVGAFGFGQPVEKVVHRPELFCELTGCSPADLATPELVAQEISSEVQGGLISFDTVLVTGRNSVGDAVMRDFASALRSHGITAPVHAA